MKSYIDKEQEYQKYSSTNQSKQKQQPSTLFQFVDNRPEAIIQRQMQALANNYTAKHQFPIQKKENKTGLPDHLKSGMEQLSGHSMDDIKVHYNSDKPAQLHAHAYAQGSHIHVASGQEKYLPHEAWHVVQQKQGRVKPTMQMKGGVQVNDDKALEKEADVMGRKAMQLKQLSGSIKEKQVNNTSDKGIILKKKILNTGTVQLGNGPSTPKQDLDYDETMLVIQKLLKSENAKKLKKGIDLAQQLYEETGSGNVLKVWNNLLSKYGPLMRGTDAAAQAWKIYRAAEKEHSNPIVGNGGDFFNNTMQNLDALADNANRHQDAPKPLSSEKASGDAEEAHSKMITGSSAVNKALVGARDGNTDKDASLYTAFQFSEYLKTITPQRRSAISQASTLPNGKTDEATLVIGQVYTIPVFMFAGDGLVGEGAFTLLLQDVIMYNVTSEKSKAIFSHDEENLIIPPRTQLVYQGKNDKGQLVFTQAN